jgi:hypothetical protein
MTSVACYRTLGSSLPSRGGTMPAFEVPDELWARITEVLPVRQRRHRWPGRKPLDDRACLNGILFVLHVAAEQPHGLGRCSHLEAVHGMWNHRGARRKVSICSRLAGPYPFQMTGVKRVLGMRWADRVRDLGLPSGRRVWTAGGLAGVAAGHSGRSCPTQLQAGVQPSPRVPSRRG